VPATPPADGDLPVLPQESPRRKQRPRLLRAARRSSLTVAQVLAWADDYFRRHGRWPGRHGAVPADHNEDWFNIDQCLRKGLRGLPGGDSLARLLARERGRRNRTRPPPLTEGAIARWARRHRRATGAWPTQGAGAVEGHPEEVWCNLDAALRVGRRGLPGGDSLALLLARRFGRRNRAASPALSEKMILAWADDHHSRTGAWPTGSCGPVDASPRDTWAAADDALRRGGRGLPGGSSLADLLARRRGKSNSARRPVLTVGQVLRWADEYQRRTGRYPSKRSGAVGPAAGELWSGINSALRTGSRGLPGGDTLAKFLARNGRGR
jgi:hypothetical protein